MMSSNIQEVAFRRLVGEKNFSELEKWRKHSLATGAVAKIISEALAKKNLSFSPALCISGALLHDIGREVSVGTLHGWYGYLLLSKDKNLISCARYCITHWLKGRTEKEILEQSSLPENLVKKILRKGDFVNLSYEDIVVCVADAMAQDDVLVDIENRYEDARRRYGDTVWVNENYRKTLEFKSRLESILGCSLYSLFSKFGESLTFAL